MTLFRFKAKNNSVGAVSASNSSKAAAQTAGLGKYTDVYIYGKAVIWICILWSLFHLVTAGINELTEIRQRSLCLTFALVLTFLLYPGSKGARQARPSIIDLLFVALSLFGCLYIFFNTDLILDGSGEMNLWDYLAALACITCIFEAARRTMGYVLPVLTVVFILYAFFGHLLPGTLNHDVITIRSMLATFYTTTDGIWGSALGVAASYVILFSLVGAFLAESGFGVLINDVSMAIAGRRPGGPAKVAVVGSGLMGMINASPVACCTTMGAFSIPQMKSIGYKAHYAGAVEAVAATGGAIMPPIMGAAAFLVCQYTGYSYGTIMIAAIIPAFLYYFCCIMQTHFYAQKVGMKGLPEEELPKIGHVLTRNWHLFIPILAVFIMLCAGLTAIKAAFISIILTFLVSFIRKETRLTPSKILHALEVGGRAPVSIVIATAIVGLIIGVCSCTGLENAFSKWLLLIGGENLFVTLIVTMIVCVVLGMGLPTTACYIVSATLLAPSLISLGVPKLAVHFYFFYLANLSNITPPVCLAASTGAAIAGEKNRIVGWTAFRLGIVGFVVAFSFVYSSEFLLVSGFTIRLLQSLVTALIGCLAMAAGFEGFWIEKIQNWKRPLFIGAGLVLFIPGAITDFVGVAVVGVLLALQFIQKKQRTNVPDAVS